MNNIIKIYITYIFKYILNNIIKIYITYIFKYILNNIIKMNDIIDIFNEKMNINHDKKEMKGLENMMENMSLNNVYMYIYIHQIYVHPKV